MIPLLDLKDLNQPMQARIEEALLRVARSGRYVLGPEVEAFEAEWAAYCGTRYCVGTGNALEALEIILRHYRLDRPGLEVIVPSNTYIATWLAVTHAGATVVPVEPDPVTMNLDPRRVEQAITRRTVAVIAVHLYGRCADMTKLRAVAHRHSLFLFEDAAQAHGASHGGLRAGSLGDAAAFSFYPSKNLGALGDAGAITTDDEELARAARRLRNYGGVGRLDHTVIGVNSRLDELQAAVLRAKLSHLDEMNRSRRLRAERYDAELADEVTVPPEEPGHVYHQYVIRTKLREALRRRLFERHGIEAHVHYPVPPHLEGAYEHLGLRRGALPVAEELASEVLSLPIGNSNYVEALARTVRAELAELREVA